MFQKLHVYHGVIDPGEQISMPQQSNIASYGIAKESTRAN